MIEGERYKVVVKLDASTLPKDGQRIRYETYEQYDLEGEYLEEEGIVSNDDGNFTGIHQIFSWEEIK